MGDIHIATSFLGLSSKFSTNEPRPPPPPLIPSQAQIEPSHLQDISQPHWANTFLAESSSNTELPHSSLGHPHTEAPISSLIHPPPPPLLSRHIPHWVIPQYWTTTFLTGSSPNTKQPHFLLGHPPILRHHFPHRVISQNWVPLFLTESSSHPPLLSRQIHHWVIPLCWTTTFLTGSSPNTKQPHFSIGHPPILSNHISHWVIFQY
jgi:hypothetical protein